MSAAVIDAGFQSKAVEAKWREAMHSAAGFSALRAWLEEKLPRAQRGVGGHVVAALSVVGEKGTGNEGAQGDEITQEYATCVWTRDAALVAMALVEAGDVEEGTGAITALAELYKRPDHVEFFDNLIESKGEGHSSKTAAPIKFHAETGDRNEWMHEQLDAIGLFLLAYCEIIKSPDVVFVARFVQYLHAVRYWDVEDRGHWEEAPESSRLSSVGCCVAALTAAMPIIEQGGCPSATIADGKEALAEGWKIVKARLADPAGVRELPAPSTRDADSAMLTLLLPPLARRLELNQDEKRALITSSLRLRRSIGVLRYEDDSYYNADYQTNLCAWLDKAKAAGSPDLHPPLATRDSWNKPGCEAEWTMFENLLLMHFLSELRLAGKDSAEAKTFAAEAARSLRRILAAIEEEKEGDEVVRLHIHESYVVVAGKRQPNDVRDLMWAVAYTRLVLQKYAEELEDPETAAVLTAASAALV
mmetsp:Transcript_22924/g.53484  ORF Transcript_22924/g.53484 Transcript_22924/m.53484 type:complete len:474 (+) Transcript_22924:50-1471(+)